MSIFIETFRITVTPADCDHLGHLNVQHYLRAIGDGMFDVMARSGLGREEIEKQQIAFVAVEAHTEFLAEAFPGDVIVMESTLLELGQRSAAFDHRLRNVSTQKIIMRTRLKCALLNLQTRKAAELPLNLKHALLKLFAAENREDD